VVYKVSVSKVDNFDQDTEADETISFALDSTAYVIDLTADNAKHLREVVQEYIDVSEKTGKVRLPPRKPDQRAVTQKTPAPKSAAAPPRAARHSPWYRAQPGDSGTLKSTKRAYRDRVIEWAEREHAVDVGPRRRLADEWFDKYLDTDAGARDARETRAQLGL